MNDLLKNIPGFRSNKTWKKVLASIYYFLALISIAGGVGSFLVLLSLPFIILTIPNIIKTKNKVAIITLVVAVIAFGIGGSLNNSKNKATDQTTVKPVETTKPDTVKKEKTSEEIKKEADDKAKADADAKAKADQKAKDDAAAKAKADAEAKAKETIKVSAVDLSKAYEDNEVKADKDYKGKSVEVNGIIDDIGVVLGQTFVVLSSGKEYSLTGVQCFFKDKAEIDKIANLKKGDTVTVDGKIDGKSLNVGVNNCTFK